MASVSSERVVGRWPWVFLVALVLLALNLRSPFVGVSAVTDELRSALDVGNGAVGLLTSLPVLCFALAAPVALALVRRYGAESAVLACLGLVLVGSLVRSSGSFAVAVLGTVVIGLGITIGNVVVPVLIRSRVAPERVGTVTGLYTAVMNVGSMIVLIGSGPLASASGWRAALLAPAVLSVVAALVWWRVVGTSRRAAPGPAEGATSGAADAPDVATAVPSGPVWRDPVAVLLVVAFAGQSTSFYSLTAWLPSILADEAGAGSAAGALASVFQVSAVVGALGVPLLALRLREPVAAGVVGLLWMAMPAQLLLAPSAYLVGSVLGGIAQGGGFALILTIVARRARSDRESAGMSTLVQSVGYAFAAVGPTLLGAVHDATGSWTAPLLVVLGTTALFLVSTVTASVSARRPRDRGRAA
ncbi:CP family cyanate transporter-like MFS transporter [Nocardioides zeae]|uniref:CP family cyanate transporter-like MFS transporter n=1 Tax=Nocardioides zeae TaxID=1457234 RepID=A0AAJ1U531_9ACTN|nr:CP family cyanate transporter-like MFS transporter [Nocardioides zeae]